MEEKRTRSKRKDESVVEKKTPSTIPIRHIFFIDGNYVQSAQDIRIEKMRHPGTEESAFFTFPKGTNTIYEVHQFNQKHRSWFIDETVSSNGKCNILARVNPLFFALYYLSKFCTDKAVPLHQIVDDEFPKATEILEELSDETILKIADMKGAKNLRAFKLNKDKALAWLACTTELMIKTLKSENIQVSENAISSNYVKEDNNENFEEDYLRYACGIVCNYVKEDLQKDLHDYLNIKDTTSASKRKSVSLSVNDMPSSKKIKVEANISIVSPSPQIKEKKETAKEKSMKKAAAGTKSIASFFKK